MQLYIGNATGQIYDFSFRVPERTDIRSEKIPSGHQIRLSGDFPSDVVDHIVKQHAPYGLIRDAEIDRAKGFHGVCYSIDKPIVAAKLTYLMNRNLDELVMRGKTIREESAVAQNAAFENNLRENGRPERMTDFEVTVQEENHVADNYVPQLSEGVRVMRPLGEGGTAPRRGRRKAA